MSHHKGDKKTALRLANKYAESYNILIQENKVLKTEINDLRANILINKEIIEGFFSKTNQTDKNKLIISKIKEENSKLYKQNELLNKELSSTHQKLTFLEQTYSETLNREKEDNDSLRMKIFLIEQSLIKKNNTITHLKKKIEPYHDDSNEYEREIYVIDPNNAIVHINDELLMYKQIYDNLIIHLKELRESMIKSESIISELQKENSKLRLQYKYHLITANKEKETMINAFQNERLSTNTRHLTDNCSKSNISQSNNNICKTQIMSNDYLLLRKMNLNKTDNSKYENEEFMEILKVAGLHQIEFEKMTKNKSCAKLTDIIEMLYSLLKDKNMTLSVIKEENEKLTTKNFQLNKDNMILLQQNVEFKKQLVHENVTNKSKSKYLDSLSNVNNTSHITTVNQNISNAISTYHKLIKLEEKTSGDILNASAGAIDLSEHDSIVYMRNVKEYDAEEKNDEDNEEDNNNSQENDRKVIDTIKQNTNKNQNDHYANNPNIMTIESITSSEFRDGCKGMNSFISTIREDPTINTKLKNKDDQETNLPDFNIRVTNL